MLCAAAVSNEARPLANRIDRAVALSMQAIAPSPTATPLPAPDPLRSRPAQPR